MKKLRESWAGVTTAIEELEREGRVLVTRTGKTEQSQEREGQMKMVFLDDIGREKDPLDQGQFAVPYRDCLCAALRLLQRAPVPSSRLTAVLSLQSSETCGARSRRPSATSWHRNSRMVRFSPAQPPCRLTIFCGI